MARAKVVRVGLYARVSTRDQQTLPMQLRAMRDCAKRRGWKVAAEIRDVGSGASLRPQREELLKRAHRRELDVIIVWRLDRWGRSLLDLIGTLQELNALGVGFVSLSEALDMTTPSGRALAECWRCSLNSSATFCATESRLALRRHVLKANLTADLERSCSAPVRSSAYSRRASPKARSPGGCKSVELRCVDWSPSVVSNK